MKTAGHINRERDGRYTHSDLDKVCVCGHRLGVHTAARVKVDGKMTQPCIVHDMVDGAAECACKCFRAVNLTEIEKRTLARWYLGGATAVRCPEFTAPCATIRSLVDKGMVGAHGLSDKGREIAAALATDGLI